jgi:hypothetical protein
MNAGAIVIIVIAASGVLMMRFRKRWLAKTRANAQQGNHNQWAFVASFGGGEPETELPAADAASGRSRI